MIEKPLGTSHVRGIVVFVVALMLFVAVVKVVAGTLTALVVVGICSTAVGLTLLAQRGPDATSRDAGTGLPDRDDAIRRLERLLANPGPITRQGAVLVASIDGDVGDDADGRRALALLSALRLAQGLRKGDQIFRISETAVGVILEPARGLNARSAQGIMERLASSFEDPFQIEATTLDPEVAIGACLQSDVPGGDAHAWLEAAERAADVARVIGEPQLYWIAGDAGRTSAWKDAESAGARDGGDTHEAKARSA